MYAPDLEAIEVDISTTASVTNNENRRYLHQCQLWLSRFRPDMKLLRFIEQGAISYGLFRADDPDPLVHEIKEFDYEQPEWGMKPRD
jgi:hypothetical protein